MEWFQIGKVFYSTGQWNFEVDTETIFEGNSFLKKKF